MRAYAPDYDLTAPRGLRETLQLVASEPGARRPIAGGTDLMVLFEAGKLPYKKLVSLHGIPELRGIAINDTHVTLGALTTYTEIQRDPAIAREFPLLARAASWTGAMATQNRGTLAGKIERVRIALASVAPIQIRCRQTEDLLTGRAPDRAAIDAAKAKLVSEIAPLSDIRSTDEYRRRISANLAGEFLESIRL